MLIIINTEEGCLIRTTGLSKFNDYLFIEKRLKIHILKHLSLHNYYIFYYGRNLYIFGQASPKKAKIKHIQIGVPISKSIALFFRSLIFASRKTFKVRKFAREKKSITTLIAAFFSLAAAFNNSDNEAAVKSYTAQAERIIPDLSFEKIKQLMTSIAKQNKTSEVSSCFYTTTLLDFGQSKPLLLLPLAFSNKSEANSAISNSNYASYALWSTFQTIYFVNKDLQQLSEIKSEQKCASGYLFSLNLNTIAIIVKPIINLQTTNSKIVNIFNLNETAGVANLHKFCDSQAAGNN